MVTAMVSPSARASARKIEPKIPVRANGTTTFQVASQRVAPNASAASRCSRGTESSTSRETEIIKGSTISAKTIHAARKTTHNTDHWQSDNNPPHALHTHPHTI